MTSMYRVTQRSVGERTLLGLQNNLGRLGQLQQQLSSGKTISKPSDSPSGTVSAMQYRSEIRTNEQYARNAQDGLGWLGTLDNTMTNALDSVRRAHELTLQGLNSGAADPAARTAMATEVRAIRDSLIGQANTSYLGRPVFGGVTAGQRAYDDTGAYVGEAYDPGVPVTGVLRRASNGAQVRVDVTGEEAFGTGNDSLFAVLGSIADDLESGASTSLGNNLDRLDIASKGMTGALATIGARYGRMEQMSQAADDRVLDLRSGLSDVEDIDLPKTIVELQLAQTAYQSALGATQRVITPSLADFLK